MIASDLKVMVAGYVCLDITPTFFDSLTGGFDQIFAPGKLIHVDDAVIGTGGAVPNTGLAMSKLGLDVVLKGTVGEDAFGMLIKNIIGEEKTASFNTLADRSSSYSIVLAMPGIDRIFLEYPGANDMFGADDIDAADLRDCCLFHFGYPPLMKRMYEDDGQELCKLFKKAKKQGTITSLDMALPDPDSPSGQADWRTILQRVLPNVDIFLPSIEEIAYMLDRPLFQKRKAQAGSSQDPVSFYTGQDCSSLAGQMLAMGVKIAGIKMGIQGYYLRTANSTVLRSIIPSPEVFEQWADRELWAPSYKAEAFGSATGAGDATVAGFLTAFLTGRSPVETVKAANALGWQNVRAIDTLSGIEDWTATLAMIADPDKPRNPLEISDPDWQYSEPDQVYLGPSDQFLKKME